MDEFLHSDITGRIIKAFYKVYNTLGYGFLEKVYENALAGEIEAMNLKVCRQQPIKVFYGGKIVGEYFADLIVEDVVIVEVKAIESLAKAHELQLLNYLRATNIEVGLLVNFGAKAEYRRKATSNTRKSLSENLKNLR